MKNEKHKSKKRARFLESKRQRQNSGELLLRAAVGSRKSIWFINPNFGCAYIDLELFERIGGSEVLASTKDIRNYLERSYNFGQAECRNPLGLDESWHIAFIDKNFYISTTQFVEYN